MACKPWNSMPLVLNVCCQDGEVALPEFPSHVTIKQKTLTGKRLQHEKPKLQFKPSANQSCPICFEECGRYATGCGYSDCGMSAHLSCLAKWFLQHDKSNTAKLIPSKPAQCPYCTRQQTWGDVVARYRELNEFIDEEDDSSSSEDEPPPPSTSTTQSALLLLDRVKRRTQSKSDVDVIEID
ncbi:hypothetical protein GEMRC1_004692 [Eukaryota sp. GEM-RC1]